MSKGFLRTEKWENFGGRIMICQQQNSHIKKLNEIYTKKRKVSAKDEPLHKTLFQNKKQIFQGMEHQRNIKHLYNYLSEPKKIADRLKDTNDFYAYPALFFRTHDKIQKVTVKEKKKKRKNQNVKLSTESSELNRKYGIDARMVGQHLPYITEFSQEQIEQYADAITRLIFNYNLNSPERLEYLKECVKRSIPKTYPDQFMDIVDEIFGQINESLKAARS